MARPRIHPTDQILDSARSLILDHGVRAATVAAIAGQSGAPVGSIYHRFGSVDELLAEVWVRAARRSQEPFLRELRGEGAPAERAASAGLAIYDFAGRHTPDARLLVSLRREDLIAGVADRDLERELRELNEPVEAEMTELTRELYGRATKQGVDRVTFAVVDLPLGAVRRHLLEGMPPPRSLRAHLRSAIRAALVDSGASSKRTARSRARGAR